MRLSGEPLLFRGESKSTRVNTSSTKKYSDYGFLLQPLVHPRKSAIRLVARHVQKFAFLLADRADFRRADFHNRIAAVAALPGVLGNILFDVGHCRILSLYFIG